MLTAKQHELIQFIQQRLEETGISPSFEEMKAALDLKSKSGVHRLISALEERGFIRRLPNRARALEVIRQPEDAVPASAAKPKAANDLVGARAPALLRGPNRRTMSSRFLHGRIAAGAPMSAGRSPEPAGHCPARSGRSLCARSIGRPMIEAGIFDEDFALIRRTNTARDGEIVVALVNNEEATLKYLHRDSGNVRLDPANSAYEAQVYAPAQVEVQGKLAGLLRRYH